MTVDEQQEIKRNTQTTSFNKQATDLLNRYKVDDLNESEFLEDLEQLAANIYGHRNEDGWCCACDADVAFAESSLRETKPEIFK